MSSLMPNLTDIALFAIFLVVLILPFVVKIVEKNLEIFLWVMGAIAVTVTGKWGVRSVSWTEVVFSHTGFALIENALLEPIIKGIVPAVLIAGLIFYYGNKLLERGMNKILKKVPMGVVIFAVIAVLGLISSVITAIIAALLLVEFVQIMPLDRNQKINMVIISCFSIGLGAALTPFGEPLSTIVISNLDETFWYLVRELGVLILCGVVALGFFGAFFVLRKPMPRFFFPTPKGAETEAADEYNDKEEGSRPIKAPDKKRINRVKEGPWTISVGLKEVLIRTVKVYFFVQALILLGGGMSVIIDKYFTRIHPMILYWVNMVSAILDNATLAAAEIAPSMGQEQINAALYGLLIAGGMLIPGNIPNIIAANKMNIKSKEWARLGVPLGLVLMTIFFVLIFTLYYVDLYPTLPMP